MPSTNPLVLGIIVLFITAATGLAQPAHPPVIPVTENALRRPLDLIRQGTTDEARRELNALLSAKPAEPEIYHQLARSYLTDFYARPSSPQGRTALSLAMEALANTLQRNPDHIPALKAKAVIHARAELLYFDPNLAYRMAARIAKLQPSANEYLLSLTDWLSGEVRFSAESAHRVPHDPMLGLDRSIALLDGVIDSALPYSNEETAGFYQLAKTLAKRGNFKESIEYFDLALARPASQAARPDIWRELGASHYRLGNFGDAARSFYRGLQLRLDPIDKWLLRLSLDAWKDASIQLPPQMQFEMADPSAAPSALAFDDMAPQLGVNRFSGNGTCAFGDIDGDGKVDLVESGSGSYLALYRHEAPRFRDITAEAGLGNLPSGYSLNLIDFDNDGHLDLYLALNGWSGPMANRLFRNLGNGKFAEVPGAGGANDGGSGFVSLWGDLDNDGLIDLVVANGVLKDGSVPQIYRNLGGGKFVNVTRQAGLDEPHTHGTIGIALGDYDKDGDLDLFFNGLQNSPNRLYRNEGSFRFKDVTRESGLARQPLHYGYVAFFTDYDNDAWPDLLVTSLAPWDAVVAGLHRFFSVPNAAAIHADAVRLFRNKRDGTFADATYEAKLYYPMGVMGAGVADLDNDGFMDFYFGTGDPQLSRLEPNRFFRNNGDGSFTDLTRAVNFARAGNKGHGVCFADIDDDGDLDLYAQLGGHYPGDQANNAFYRNLRGNQNRWLEIELEGVKSNRFAIGAQITAKAAASIVYREVKGSEGFGATNTYRVHLGLGQAAKVDTLEVRWPSGLRQEFPAVETNHLYKLREGATKLVR